MRSAILLACCAASALPVPTARGPYSSSPASSLRACIIQAHIRGGGDERDAPRFFPRHQPSVAGAGAGFGRVPGGAGEEKAGRAARPPPELPEGWRSAADGKGRTYYYSTVRLLG